MHLVSYRPPDWKPTRISAASTEAPFLLVTRGESVMLCLSHFPAQQSHSNSKTTQLPV